MYIYPCSRLNMFFPGIQTTLLQPIDLHHRRLFLRLYIVSFQLLCVKKKKIFVVARKKIKKKNKK